MNWKARATMDETESKAQSFIVRIWVEERAGEAGQGVWRGHLTHVPGGERRYLKNLDEIGGFIAPYLEEMGIRLGMCWHIRNRLRDLMGRAKR
jgi:hypothetical protein